jgi:hypothetical protein
MHYAQLHEQVDMNLHAMRKMELKFADNDRRVKAQPEIGDAAIDRSFSLRVAGMFGQPIDVCVVADNLSIARGAPYADAAS